MAENKTFDFDGKDPVARLLAVILAGVLTFWSTFRSSDRFTGAEATVLEARIDQLEMHISPAGQDKVHEAIHNRINRLEQDISRLPPHWLKEDIVEIKRKLEALERDHGQVHSVNDP